MSAPTLTRLTFATVATRSPAMITGTAMGRSTPPSLRSGPYPSAIAAIRTCSGTQLETVYDAAQQQRNRVDGQGDDDIDPVEDAGTEYRRQQ